MVDLVALFVDFGALVVVFWLLFGALGGHLVPTGSNRDPCQASAGRDEGEGNSVLEPYDH